MERGIYSSEFAILMQIAMKDDLRATEGLQYRFNRRESMIYENFVNEKRPYNHASKRFKANRKHVADGVSAGAHELSVLQHHQSHALPALFLLR